MTHHRLACLALTLAGAACRPAAMDPPPDFELTASYSAGFSNSVNFEVTIDSGGVVRDKDVETWSQDLAETAASLASGRYGSSWTGKAGRPLERRDREEMMKEKPWLEERVRERKAQLPPRLEREQVRRLYALVENTGFMTLPPLIVPDPRPTDQPTLVLEVRSGGATHKTAVYGWESVRSRSDARRFGKVWREVLTLVPSPNAEQTPERYR